MIAFLGEQLNSASITFFNNLPNVTHAYEYSHPKYSNKNLYFVIDTVHILKCIRNNWLNKKPEKEIVYLHVDDDQCSELRIASFNALKQLHAPEKSGKQQLIYLNEFLIWLQRWETCPNESGLTSEKKFCFKAQPTNIAEAVRTLAVKVRKYSNYFLSGKIQTNNLEDRFEKYLQLPGFQFHISVRQIFESKDKLRNQNLLPFVIISNFLGNIPIYANSCIL
ncbi:uncharacterized protein LOC111616283 [Centruroides sculpturatus]|uniref:uncharacterized protein LOC111616283 n=1 Tax=Centruroides sculpturatus TaxID=218467 RepID=UPI000C6EF042|nr:uncharacterized protein LOC111616283 [Centruroides sculpturatus]